MLRNFSGSARRPAGKAVQIAHLSRKAAPPARKGGVSFDLGSGADHLDDEFEKF